MVWKNGENSASGLFAFYFSYCSLKTLSYTSWPKNNTNKSCYPKCLKGEVEVVIYLGQSLWLKWMFKRIESIQFRKGSVMDLILTFMLLGKSLDTCIFVIFFFSLVCVAYVCVFYWCLNPVSPICCANALSTPGANIPIPLKKFLFLCMLLFCLHVYLWTMCMSGAFVSQKRRSDHLKLELQIINCEPTVWMLGIKTALLERAAPNSWAISQLPTPSSPLNFELWFQ